MQLIIPFPDLKPLTIKDFKKVILKHFDDLYTYKSSGEEHARDGIHIPNILTIDRGITFYMRDYNYFLYIKQNPDLNKHDLNKDQIKELYTFACDVYNQRKH